MKLEEGHRTRSGGSDLADLGKTIATLLPNPSRVKPRDHGLCLKEGKKMFRGFVFSKFVVRTKLLLVGSDLTQTRKMSELAI